MTLDTISDILLALDAELDKPKIKRFSEYNRSNFAHQVVDRIVSTVEPPRGAAITMTLDASNQSAISLAVTPQIESEKNITISDTGSRGGDLLLEPRRSRSLELSL